ncbi:MAG: hypothetical protein VX733_08840 [Candidatus Latescibacterota bacterium]|nr:hypothetical protein [Candidatus Latescibacterota bacterium]
MTRTVSHHLQDDGVIPNNCLPLLVYSQVVDHSVGDPARAFEQLFHGNGWGHSWRNGIYPFRHYHSTAHEVLGIAAGSAKVEFGGPEGVVLDVSAGDAVLIPAGVSHYNLGASSNLLVIGTYPPGPDWDLCRDSQQEYEAARGQIPRVPTPTTDPVRGASGGIHDHWQAL